MSDLPRKDIEAVPLLFWLMRGDRRVAIYPTLEDGQQAWRDEATAHGADDLSIWEVRLATVAHPFDVEERDRRQK